MKLEVGWGTGTARGHHLCLTLCHQCMSAYVMLKHAEREINSETYNRCSIEHTYAHARAKEADSSLCSGSLLIDISSLLLAARASRHYGQVI